MHFIYFELSPFYISLNGRFLISEYSNEYSIINFYEYSSTKISTCAISNHKLLTSLKILVKICYNAFFYTLVGTSTGKVDNKLQIYSHNEIYIFSQNLVCSISWKFNIQVVNWNCPLSIY